MPEKVEIKLEQHPYVNSAKVFSKKNSILGALVACELVVEEKVENLPYNEIKNDILSFCKKELQSFEVPVLFKIVDSLTLNSTGKKFRKL
jgi:acyl-coenzyme A synthetase/AMP-(fatty) acid ligase